MRMGSAQYGYVQNQRPLNVESRLHTQVMYPSEKMLTVEDMSVVYVVKDDGYIEVAASTFPGILVKMSISVAALTKEKFSATRLESHLYHLWRVLRYEFRDQIVAPGEVWQKPPAEYFPRLQARHLGRAGGGEGHFSLDAETGEYSTVFFRREKYGEVELLLKSLSLSHPLYAAWIGNGGSITVKWYCCSPHSYDRQSVEGQTITFLKDVLIMRGGQASP
jgi:hypothetical protein